MKGSLAFTALLALAAATFTSAEDSHSQMRLVKKRHAKLAAAHQPIQVAEVASSNATEVELSKRAVVHQTFGTYYDIPIVGAFGACGWPVFPFGYTVALASPMYGDLSRVSSYCGKTITIKANGRTHTATIADACPTGGGNCGGSDLDMSKALFEALMGSTDAGKVPIQWQLGDADEIAAASRASAAAASSSSAAASRSAARASSLASAARASSISASKAAASSRSEAKASASAAAAASAAGSAVAGPAATPAPEAAAPIKMTPGHNLADFLKVGDALQAMVQQNLHA